MAHKRGLDGTYLQPTREECFTEFLKAVPGLTVDPTEKQKFEIHNLELEKSELELVNKSNKKLQSEVDELQNQFNKLQSEKSNALLEQSKELRADVELLKEWKSQLDENNKLKNIYIKR